MVVNKTKGSSFAVRLSLSPRQKEMILAGGALNVSRQK